MCSAIAGAAIAEQRERTSRTPLAFSGPVRLLYVSLYSEHKNLTTLLDAMPLLNKQGARRFGLTTTLEPASEQVGWGRHRAQP